ncbi:MAG: M56 family metallopeptidase [Verrucomicrobiales bacterium]
MRDRVSLPPQARHAVDLVNEGPAAPAASATSLSLAPHPVADETSAAAPLPWLAIFWVSGVSIFGLRMLAGMIQLRWRRKSSSPAPAPIANAAMELCRQLSIRVPVAVLMAHRHAMPMTWGVLRPAVLLPPDAEEWPESRLRAVLLHELSHLRRADVLTGTIAMFASACHWFNPVAWFVFHLMQSDRELACDDAVLAEGMLPSDYASHLLAISGGDPASGVPTALASAMARTGGVEERIVTVLDAGISRHRMSAMTGWAVSIAALVTASVVGSVQLLIAEPQDQSPPGPPGIDINGPMTFQTASHACVATVAENGTSGHLHLVDLKDNSLIWSIDTALPPHDRPLMSKGHVLLMTSDRTLHCYAIADGALRWSHETDQEAEYFLDAVQYDGQGGSIVILATLGGDQITLDVETGNGKMISYLIESDERELHIGPSLQSSGSLTGFMIESGEEVPPQFRDAYLNQRPTGYINDPQHLLAKEVRSKLVESLRGSSLERNQDTQVFILNQNQKFPLVTTDYGLWTDDARGLTIAYYLGDQSRVRSWPGGIRVPEFRNQTPSFELMAFLDSIDEPMEPQSKFADMVNPDEWNVIVQGSGHVFPVSHEARTSGDAERSGYFIVTIQPE